MKYISTRDNYRAVEAAEAIRLGMVPEGGLFVPEEIPEFSLAELREMQGEDYRETAVRILEQYLTDFSREELQAAVRKAYNSGNFAREEIAPLRELTDNIYILELWHGPTAAFKDLALQLMPYLMVQAVNKAEIDNEIVILVATSGDTGKAALEGFKDVPGINIIVFYPRDGVSKIQERQMVTTGGDNTAVVAVKGNFDDCQNAVKEVFGDRGFKEQINRHGFQFSSANSINWGRLVPQIVYYFTAYNSLVRQGRITTGKKINIAVPTGNFGNILAGYYAFRMGLPVNRFICASNENNILTDFLRTGVYNLDRDFRKTISPSMDILISSNLERFLFIITGYDGAKVARWYRELRSEGRFEVDEETKEKIRSIFSGEFATEPETKATIKYIAGEYGYLVDPHTAVGIAACQKFRGKSGKAGISGDAAGSGVTTGQAGKDKNERGEVPVVIDSTANPYKFGRAVLESLQGEVKIDDDFAVLEKLHRETGVGVHRALDNLAAAGIKHERYCKAGNIREEIKDILFKKE